MSTVLVVKDHTSFAMLLRAVLESGNNAIESAADLWIRFARQIDRLLTGSRGTKKSAQRIS